MRAVSGVTCLSVSAEEPLSAHNDDESPDVIIDVDVEQEEIDRHDSQMISQESSEGEDAENNEG